MAAALHCFDHMDYYYAMPDKPVGYLRDMVDMPPHVDVHLYTGTTSLNLRDHVSTPSDLCFIDAADRHPWPLIDMLPVPPLRARSNAGCCPKPEGWRVGVFRAAEQTTQHSQILRPMDAD